MSILSYRGSPCIDTNSLGWIGIKAESEHDYDKFVNARGRKKIIVINTNSWMVEKKFEFIQKLVSHVDKIFIFGAELHANIVDELCQLDYPNINMYLSGTLTYSFKNAKTFLQMFWFDHSCDFYCKIRPEILDNGLSPYSVKEKYFDILLGNKRQNRDFVFNYINTHQLNDKVVMTYINGVEQNLLNSPNFIIETNNTDFFNNVNYNSSANPVKYYGHNMLLSQIVPLTVYNQTAYSIITETWENGTYSFYTEKTAKTILAKRLFIMIASKNCLKDLRRMGFRTFGSVIDESYDEIDDDQTRWQAAMTQMSLLVQRDQSEILSAIQEITEHNFNIIKHTTWHNNQLINQEIEKLID